MSDTSGVGTGKLHFTADEAGALLRGAASNDIVRRDTHIEANIHGMDPTHRQVKAEQRKSELDLGVVGGYEVVDAMLTGCELAGIEAHLGTGAGVASPIVALIVGFYDLSEAEKKGVDQNTAVARENAHVAVLGSLDLPPSYASKRLDHDYASVPRGFQSVSYRWTEAIKADPKGHAVLQLNADRGMNAARDALASGKKIGEFFRANPKIAEAYLKDAAFHEGFDAFVYTKTMATPQELKEMMAKLDERDGWYSQNLVAIRV